MSVTEKKKKGVLNYRFPIHVFFILFSLLFILPLLLIFAVSISNEKDVLNYGYRLIPKRVDFTAYKIILENPRQLIDGYKVTMSFTIIGTILSTLVMAMLAYPISRTNYKLRRPISFFVFFTMLFNGGLVPSYIVNTQVLHLGDNFLIYILPGMCSVFNIIILRTFFMGIPPSLFESAKIDGASELGIFFRIVLPLSKPVIATIALMGTFGRWNDWYTSMIYINKPNLISLQYLLQKLLLEIQWLQDNYTKLPPGVSIEEISNLPTETTRMAICILVAGPVLFIFPFFQKYFTKGLTVGAIKG